MTLPHGEALRRAAGMVGGIVIDEHARATTVAPSLAAENMARVMVAAR